MKSGDEEIMRFVFSVVACLAAVISVVPAQALPLRSSFVGPRLEAHLGYDRLSLGGGFGNPSSITYGGGAGYDIALDDRGTIAGVELSADFSDTQIDFVGFPLKAKRDLDVSVRTGTALGANGLIYIKVGYANSRLFVSDGVRRITSDLDGVRVGIGYELAVSRHTYVKTEYRHSNYQNGVSRNQGVVGVGLRF